MGALQVNIDNAHVLTVWLSVLLTHLAHKILVPQDLSYTGIRQVATYFKEGMPYVVLLYDDGSLVRLSAETINELPVTASFDPPYQHL